MILEDISEKLKTIDPNTFYGMVDSTQVTGEWNYIVFMRKRLTVGANKQELSDRFTVAIVRENYIPEGLEKQVIEKMCEIPGMRIGSADCEYNYTQKPNTNTVVELLTMEFVRARKRAGE